jgi:tetratricopeptide (TPR) repeat protein
MVTVDDQEITVMAFPAEASALDFVMPMLKAGKIAEAVPYLESLTKSAPANAAGALQPGHRLQRAGPVRRGHHPAQACRAAGPGPRPCVGRHRQCVPPHAQARSGAQAFEKAVEADPNDGYTRRNLGGMLIGFKRIDEAVTHLRRALALMPDDPQAIFGLATALEAGGHGAADEEADRLYLRFIEEHPNSPMVEQAEKARTAFAQKRLKSSSVGGFRPDVMMYIASALQTFKKLGPQKRQAIALEIAVLGRSGLDINDPDRQVHAEVAAGQVLGAAPAGHHVHGVPPDRPDDGDGRRLRRGVPSGAGDAASSWCRTSPGPALPMRWAT